MRRILIIALASVAGLALIGLSISVARPQWLPGWARSGFGPRTEDAGLFCKEHGVPEKFCTICHEELKSSLMLCAEHGGLPEDICTLCHPEVEEKYHLTVCKEHGLPESFCSKCGNGPEASLDEPDDGWCATHNLPESLCAVCLADPSTHGDAGKVCRRPLPTVKLAAGSIAGEVGIETSPVLRERRADSLSANAETAFDANRFAEIRPRVHGFLHEVKVDLGEPVRAGDILAVVDSPDVSTAKSLYLGSRDAEELAEATYTRTETLVRSRAVASKNALEDLTALNQARSRKMDAEQKLRNYGFSDAQIERIAEERDTTSLLPIPAPIDGTTVRRHAVPGEAVEPTSILFAIADTGRIWLWIDVYEADVNRVAVGQPVRFSVSGGGGPEVPGRVTWVGAEVDPVTRTTRVRAEAANSDGSLRANQFGLASIQVGDEHDAVLVPREALQHKDGVDLVFLPMDEGVYRAQRVVARPPAPEDLSVEVSWGLKSGESVVTVGSYLLKTEIMKGAIGAGCCD